MLKKPNKILALFAAGVMSVSVLGGCTDKNNGNTDNTSANGAGDVNTQNVNDIYINNDWTYGSVSIGGGGFVTGVIATCEENLYYARTDVGGAYRWSEDDHKWVCLTYFVSEEDRGLLGIDGIAVDPQDAKNVYLLAGTEYFSNGKTVICISHDYGNTFDTVDVTDLIRVHGNGMGRGNGERIAVDPHNSDIIFMGGRTGGMLKSTDGGYTWEKIESFPVSKTSNGNGINIITFDPDSENSGSTQRIYAGVSQKNDDAGNVFVSEDGGKTWNVLANSINKYMPQRIKLDSKGNVYVVYASSEGPWNASIGAIYRYGKDGSAVDIAPKSSAFGDIVIDPNDENRLVAVTTQMWMQQANGGFGDVFYTSTDGGQTWTNLLDNMQMSNNDMPWIEGCAIHWCCSLAMNPFNTNEILVTSGNGIFACDNVWDESALFYFDARGIEETVPEDIITMKDYPLISAVGDYDGFVHEDIYTPATRHQDKIGSTSSITIAAKNRDCWAKVGGDESNMLLTYTTDAGKTWNRIENSPEVGKKLYKGKVALNADGTRLIWSPSSGTKAYYTEDWGKTWTKVEGLAGNNFYILGDPDNADYVYATGSSSSYVSSDGGKTFSRIKGADPSYKRFCVVPDSDGTFYMPYGAGLMKVTGHGENYELVAGVKFCEAIGIGKAKNDGDPYVLYMWGIPMDASEKGIYMSEDDGVTWVRINDDLHQFGGTGNGVFISGDLNVYGRCYMSTVGLGIVYCDMIEK